MRALEDAAHGRSPLAELLDEFGLSPLARLVLMVTVAPHISDEAARLYRIASGDPARALIDEGLITRLLGPRIGSVHRGVEHRGERPAAKALQATTHQQRVDVGRERGAQQPERDGAQAHPQPVHRHQRGVAQPVGVAPVAAEVVALDEGALLVQTFLPAEASLDEVDRLNHRNPGFLRYREFARRAGPSADPADVDAYLPPFAPEHKLDTARVESWGNVVSQDMFYRHRQSIQQAMDRVPQLLAEADRAWHDRFGRAWGVVERYRCDGADTAVVTMGSMCGSARAATGSRARKSWVKAKRALTSKSWPRRSKPLACPKRRARRWKASSRSSVSYTYLTLPTSDLV